ncbi:hypothetical protein [Bifidobacterium animalis]|uniref:hypothetical protein n=1 Tax=Bifidobacterium animalis TaxID=28025 RepID=UPI00101F4E1B|nr:hypothetical protein [Bifidobacterium animalis]RYN04968.1 hypothetical protein PG1528B_1568 [Bifidobacterium animalis subsp. lactis]
MSNTEHVLVWLDVETTAIRPDDGQLLEVGVKATPLTAPGRILFDYHAVIRHAGINLTAQTIHAVRMHIANGLIDECLNRESGNAKPVATMLEELTEGLTALAESGYILHPAGTNVDFDLDWLDRAYSRLTATAAPGNPDRCRFRAPLNYRKLDMSTIRLTCMAMGDDPSGHNHTGTHRVDDCLHRDMTEYGEWMNHQKGNE